jgi:hypothetical protein
MINDDGSVMTDEQLSPYYGGSGSDTSTATDTTQPKTQGINSAPSGPATTDPVGSGFSMPVATTPTPAPYVAPTGSQASNTSDALDTWFKEHGSGERYSWINGSLVDMAALTYNSLFNTKVGVGGMTQDIKDAYGLTDSKLVDAASSANAASESRWQYALTHGGFFTPETNPNANPLDLSSGKTQGGVANDGVFSVGLVTQGSENGDVSATPSGVAGSTSTGATGPVSGSGSGSGVSEGGSAINRLIDLAAAMYASAGVKGGTGTGFGGLVGGPLGDATNTGELAEPTPPQSHKGLVIVVLLLAGVGFWWYKKHHHKAA